MTLIAVSLLGLVMFLWPFVGSAPPAAAVAAALALGSVGILAFVEATTRRLDARRFALLAAIAALDAALRLVIVVGIGGFSPIFFLILVAGYVYGPSYGMLCGATALLVSAIVTGGIGPWLPYEAIACGWVGAAAGLAGMQRRSMPTKRDIVILALVAVVTGFVYGALMDVWDWTTFYRNTPSFGWIPGLGIGDALARFGRFYAVTSLAYDSVRAIGDALAVIVLGLPVMAALARVRRRLDVHIITRAENVAVSAQA